MAEWTPVEGSYRCGECHDWQHLKAWAEAVAEGPLGPDGQLTEYHDVDDFGPYESSIICTLHIAAPVERFYEGRWCRWWSCPNCHGTGRVRDTSVPYSSRTWSCPEGRQSGQGDTVYVGGPYRIHEEWRPVAVALGSPTSC